MTVPAPTLLGQSQAMQRLFQAISLAAGCEEPLLVTGERGTGKELVARAVHETGRRRGGPFVLVDCAALCPALAGGDLFGHERGAFTGATNQRRGLLEQADGGTLFLDEIAHLVPATQAALLRFLEYGSFRRIGGSADLRINARIVAATNADLGAATASGAFLPDLYDRLNVLRIVLPPLRDRGEDIELLARHFWRTRAGNLAFPDGLVAQLNALPFPGNVRELRNVVVRLAIAARYLDQAGALADPQTLWDDALTLCGGAIL